MDTPLISIIVPAYNVAEYIEDCINSLIKQNFKDLEIIIVNDGSTDNSGDIIDRLKSTDNRIVVINKQNEGLVKARLDGVLRARGKYVTFVDGDDWIDCEMYDDLIGLATETDVDIVMSGIYRYVSPEDVIVDVPRLGEGRYDREKIQTHIWPTMLWGANCDGWEVDPSLCTKIFKREVIKKQLLNVKDMNVYFAEDTITIFPLLLMVDSVYISKKCYYYHRQKQTGDVASYIKSPAFFDKTYKVYDYLRQVFREYQVQDVFDKQLDCFYMNAVRLKQKCYLDLYENKETVFPFYKFNKNEKVVLYGAGKVGEQFMKQNEEYNFVDIVLWTDRNYLMLSENKNICSPKKIRETEFDKLLIAVQSSMLAEEIKKDLVSQGVDETKIMWVGTNILTLRR